MDSRRCGTNLVAVGRAETVDLERLHVGESRRRRHGADESGWVDEVGGKEATGHLR